MKRGASFVRYSVACGSAENLVEWLHRRGVEVREVETDEKTVKFTADRKDNEKIFAFCRTMCYNIEVLRYSGRAAPFYFAREKPGIVLGAAAFCAALALTDGIVTDVSYRGDAPGKAKEISAVLREQGLDGVFRWRSDTGGTLEREILASSPDFTFVSVRKQGHKLIVEAYCRGESPREADVGRENIVAPTDGIVLRMHVIGGRAKVSVGQEVQKGDLLVEGVYELKGEERKTLAVAEIELAARRTFSAEILSEDERSVGRVVALALAAREDEEVLSTSAATEQKDGKIVCTVTVVYRVRVP